MQNDAGISLTNKQALIRFIVDHILGFYTSNAVLEDGQSLVLAGVFKPRICQESRRANCICDLITILPITFLSLN
jgi:hypothetical protein